MANRINWIAKPPLGAVLNPTHELVPRLVCAFPMNEGGGAKIFDASPLKNDGTIPASGPTWGGGIHGPCLNFSTSQPITFAGIVLSTVNSISFWFKPSSGNQSFALVFGTDGGVAIYYRGIDKRIQYYHSSAENSTNFVEDQWHHVMITFDGTNVLYYVDGVRDGQATYNLGFTAVRMGNDSSAEKFNGSISMLFAWDNRVLSANDARTLYTQPFCMFKAPRRRMISKLSTGSLFYPPSLAGIGSGGKFFTRPSE